MKNLTLTISYIINNLRWHARYSLQILADGQTQFQMFADIINSSPLTYQFNQTDLLSPNCNKYQISCQKNQFDLVIIIDSQKEYNLLIQTFLHVFLSLLLRYSV